MSNAILLVAALALALLPACDRAQDRGAESFLERVLTKNGRSGRVELDRGKGSIRVTLGTAPAPSGWPDDVPLYPNARRAKMRGATARQQKLLVTSDDSPVVMAQFYRGRLGELGWTVERERPGDGALRASKGERLLVARFSRGELLDASRADIVIDRGA
ncbi:MAG: hypothetical protein QOD06_1785 [Candidatus Binatota bacterium]|jgi:hypothetical protein|nr:hypothetical protein [Candidatus Binatota bacterium]